MTAENAATIVFEVERLSWGYWYVTSPQMPRCSVFAPSPGEAVDALVRDHLRRAKAATDALAGS